jgi:hypothetical protein
MNLGCSWSICSPMIRPTLVGLKEGFAGGNHGDRAGFRHLLSPYDQADISGPQGKSEDQPHAKQIAPAEGITPPAEVHACTHASVKKTSATLCPLIAHRVRPCVLERTKARPRVRRHHIQQIEQVPGRSR